MKKYLPIAVLALAGCQSGGKHSASAVTDKQIDAQVEALLASTGKPVSESERQSPNWYAGQIFGAITKNFFIEDEYKGKACTVRIALERDGTVTSTKTEGGDPALCQAAVKAVQQAKIPPAPNEKVYQMFKYAPLDFKP